VFVPFGLGKYTVVGRIKYGGMGEVLKAQGIGNDGMVTTWAIKRPLPDVVDSPELLALFWREAELLQKLKHKAFPEVAEIGVARGIPFVVMEFVDGCTVADLVESNRRAGTTLRSECWVHLAGELSEAVEHLHRFKRGSEKLIHGDIRAANVMVDVTGSVKLLDLGVALAGVDVLRRVLRSRRDDMAPTFLDQFGRSPELDTYAIGRLLVDCLGGLSALEDSNRLPQGLVEVVKRSVDKSGLYLYRTARSLRRDIAGYLDASKRDLMRTELATAAAAARSLPA